MRGLLSFLWVALLIVNAGRAQVWVRDPNFAPVFVNDELDLTSPKFVPIPDGRMFVLGTSLFLSPSPFTHLANGAIATPAGVGRLRADGTADSTFVVSLADNEVITAIAPLANGRALAVRVRNLFGTDPSSTATIVRLLETGTVDPTFNPMPSNWQVKLMPLAGGRVLAWGQTFRFPDGTENRELARFSADGILDTGFVARTGLLTVAIKAAVELADGSVVCSLQVSPFSPPTTNHVVRLFSDGRRDETFVPPRSLPLYQALAVQSDGKLLALEEATFVRASPNAKLTRFLSNGALDASFSLEIPDLHSVEQVVVRGDGQIVLQAQLGKGPAPWPSTVLLVSPTGALQRELRDVLGADHALRLAAIQSDGSPWVVHGLALSNMSRPGLLPAAQENVNASQPTAPPTVTPYRPQLARLSTDGTKATAMAPGIICRRQGVLNAVWCDTAGRIVVVGVFTHIDGHARPGFARFSAGGSLDMANVPALPEADSQEVRLRAMDGSYLVRQSVIGPRDPDDLHRTMDRLVHLQADGTVSRVFAPPDEFLAATAWHAGTTDGRFLVSRFEPDHSREENFRLIWLGPDGQRIGYLNTQISGLPQSPSLALVEVAQGGLKAITGPLVYSNPVSFIQPVANDQFLLGGSFEQINHANYSRLVRLNADGSVDPTYQPDFSGYARTTGVYLDRSDGRVLVGLGAKDNYSTVELRRLLPDGNRDTTYIHAPYWPSWVRRTREDGLPDLNLSPAVVAPGAFERTVSFSPTIAGDGSAWVQGSGLFPDRSFSNFFKRFVPTEVAGITVPPWDQMVDSGDDTYFLVGLGTMRPASYQWLHDGRPLAGEANPWLSLREVQPSQAGQYQARVTIDGQEFTSAAATLTVRGGAARLVALSALTMVRPDAEPEVGFTIASDGSAREWLLRATGPSLQMFGVASPLADPELALFNATHEIARNRGGATTDAVRSLARDVGAFRATEPSFFTPSNEAALIPTLTPGRYSARLRSTTGQSGVALFEIYDTIPRGASGALSNGSVRAVTAPTAPVTAGFVVAGQPLRLLIRGAGPALAQFGLTGAIENPRLAVYRSDGQRVAENDGWRDGAAIRNAAGRVGAFPWTTGTRDAALLLTLEPGAYTAQLSSTTSESGVGLIEIYVVND